MPKVGFPALTALTVLAGLLCLATVGGSASAETPREKKQAEAAERFERPAYQPPTSGSSQQQERQDRVRPAPVRDRAKPGESQQDARQRRNKDKALD